MSVTSREIGTLIVVVLKARNLPNKRHIGKQAPYCLVTHNTEKRRTKVIKRGGQHPEWDDEFRFTICEDVQDVPRPVHGSDLPPPLPPKRSKGPRKIKGGCFLKLQCYADDARDPDFIGETMVDLTEALTKGETDEWFTLMNKDKYAGEVYLELTFWSNEPPPEKKYPGKPAPSKTYGGPGSFTPIDGSPLPSTGSSVLATPPRGVPNDPEVNHLNSLPSHIRLSTSRPELYTPIYEQKHGPSPSTVDHLANDFSELGMIDDRRRESYPPASNTIRPSTSVGFSARQSESLDLHGHPAGSGFVYDNLPPPTAPTAHTTPPQYRPPYENISVSGYSRHGRPRYSMPSSSSGFVPAQTPVPAPVSYSSALTYPTETSGFTSPHGHLAHPPPSPHPLPPASFPSQFHHHGHIGYASVPPTPAPSVATNPPGVTPLGLSHSMNEPISHAYHHSPEQGVPFPSNVPHEYMNGSSVPLPLPTSSIPPPASSTPPQVRPRYPSASPSPPREFVHQAPAPTLSTSTGSRPLPLPGQSQRDRRMSVAGSTFTGNGSPQNPLPPVPQYRRVPSSQSLSLPTQLPNPYPEVHGHRNISPARPALPQPPGVHHSTPTKYQAINAPPPLPDMPPHKQLPPPMPSSSFGDNTYFQGLPPRSPLPHTNHGQSLPPPPLPADWQ
ncbi:hypothetical protein ID866_1226 [Astraeus odoratus]|nr:hypothetical protein ID866_1226 [Astraeus odoratus]